MRRRGIGAFAALLFAGSLLPAVALGQDAGGGEQNPGLASEPPPPPPTAELAAEVEVAPPPPTAGTPPPPPIVVVQPVTHAELALELQAAERLRFAGVLTFSLGTSAVGLGSILVLVGALGMGLSAVALDWDNLGAWGALYFTGAFMAVAGAAATVASIPMWIIGVVRVNRISRAMMQAAPVLAFDPGSGSGYAGLVFRL